MTSYKSYLVIKKTPAGFGVFTKVKIPAGIPVCEFSGDFFNKENLKHDYSQILQIGPNLYLGPSGDIDDYVNHSCNPNCGLHIVGNRAFLYSLYVIPADSELTFDYSTSSTDRLHEWNMECKCGAYNCRKFISGFQYLDEKLKKEYKEKGILPLFMRNKIFR